MKQSFLYSVYLMLVLTVGTLMFPKNSMSKTIIDIELDPIAYTLNGYSGHLGVSWRGGRFALGAFSAELPDSFVDSELLSVKFEGFGAKYDFSAANFPGFFFGLEMNRMRFLVDHNQTENRDEEWATYAGARFGYRVLFDYFTLTPWVGVNYLASGEDAEVDGESYEMENIKLFPTIHIGYMF